METVTSAGSHSSSLDPKSRRVVGAAVAACLIGWWPAFTLGAWGAVFFEQILALWVAATAVFLVVLLTRPREVLHRPAWLALLIPSIWIVLSYVLSTGSSSILHQLLYRFGVIVTLIGFPAMSAVLVRILVPGAERLRGRNAAIALTVVGVVMLGSYVVGRSHPRLLSCEDFTISGNSTPPGCTPGEGTTVNRSPE